MNRYVLSVDQSTQGTKALIFDRNGNIVSYTEYEYDSDNKESKSTEYGRDEVNPEKLRIVRETFYERS